MADVDTEPDDSTLRTPIVAVLGHVDHGKTTLLDTVRGSAVAESESGAITQHIGATAVPLDIVSSVAGELVDPTDFELPGLLFIDTPGHHSFSTLRSRGGALADIAILVVDVGDGFQPQTEEALDILRRTNTPFVVAANKIDTVPGWNPREDVPIRASYDQQSDRTRDRLDEALYDIIGSLSDHDLSSDLYWRVQDFQANVGVVPVSAKTGEGIADLLAVLMGLSQRYLSDEMAVDVAGPGAGTVLEVKDEKGFGTTADVVLYDGRIEVGDQVVVGGSEEPIVTEVRALLQPKPLAEIRGDSRFEQVESVTAAAGIKIAAPDLAAAMAGAPVRVVGDREVQTVAGAVQEELAAFTIETDEAGIVMKADTLGSLEAMADSLREADIPIVRAEVGDIAPRDIAVAATADKSEHRVVLGFNVAVLADAERDADEADVELFVHDVIYRLVEEYEDHVDSIAEAQQEQVLTNITRPARFQILEDHVFRQSDPAVVGVEILSGTLGRNVSVGHLRDGEIDQVGQVQGIQSQGDDVETARAGERVSVAIDGPTVGRQIDEGDELWVVLPEKHAKILEQELTSELPADEREALSQFLDRRRVTDPFWGK